MKYKIRTDIVEKICYYRGFIVEEEQAILYLEKMLFSSEEIELGFRIIELEEDIEIYISQALESVIDHGLKQYAIDFPQTSDEQVFVPPRRFLQDPYEDFYDVLK